MTHVVTLVRGERLRLEGGHATAEHHPDCGVSRLSGSKGRFVDPLGCRAHGAESTLRSSVNRFTALPAPLEYVRDEWA